jgi:hypothetical protein
VSKGIIRLCLSTCSKFYSKKRRINLNVPLKAVEEKEMETIDEKTDGCRTMIIQVRSA